MWIGQEHALKLATEINDILTINQSYYWLGVGKACRCDFEEAELYLTKALEIGKAANSQWGTSSIKSVLSYFVYYFQGRIDLGIETSKDAVKIADWILKAIQADKENDIQFSLGKDYLVYAKQLLSNEKNRHAKKYIGYAINKFKTCGADGWVEKTENVMTVVK